MAHRYQELADELRNRIEKEVYLPGERLPGVRKLAAEFEVSVSTVQEAYAVLVDEGLLKARERSGYYVCEFMPKLVPLPQVVAPVHAAPQVISGQDMTLNMIKQANRPGVVQFGPAVPDPSYLPVAALQRSMLSAAKKHPQEMAGYCFPPGLEALRRQLVKRMFIAGCSVRADDLVITSGCQEALFLSLRAITRPGDVVAVETPTFYGLLQVIDALRLKALEIPTDPLRGISLDALQFALEKWPVKACVLTSNFQNPLGFCMADADKKRLVELARRHKVVVIEDDIYGDLGFDDERPRAIKAFDTDGQVIYCSSFSKTLSPGLRVGWVAAGPYQRQIEYYKYILNLSTPSMPQLAVARFLEKGTYERHLREVRRSYRNAVARMRRAIAEHFPPSCRVSQPRGGYVLWIELPDGLDAGLIHRRAMEHQISVAPGKLFDVSGQFTHCLRINCAVNWSPRIELALQRLGLWISEELRIAKPAAEAPSRAVG